jgi:hypothetical protein
MLSKSIEMKKSPMSPRTRKKTKKKRRKTGEKKITNKQYI